MSKRLVVDIRVHQEYDIRPITEFFGEEDEARNRLVVDKRFMEAHPEVVSDTAERDSEWAQKNGIPAGTDWVLFIGMDGIRCVCRYGGGLYRDLFKLGDTFGSLCWVACPCK